MNHETARDRYGVKPSHLLECPLWKTAARPRQENHVQTSEFTDISYQLDSDGNVLEKTILE